MLTLRRVVAVVFVFFLGFGFGSPAPNKLKRAVGAVNPGSYIVVLKPGVDKPNVVESHRAFAKATNTDDVEIVYSDWDVVNAYSARLSETALDSVLNDPNVAYVEEDSIVECKGEATDVPETSDASTSSGGQLVNRAFGSGVDIYIIGTGVRTTHTCFTGRASFAAVFGGYPAQDGNGQGTFSASLAAGVNFGPATQALVKAVKVLSDSGSGTTSDVISGINFITNAAIASGRPSVVLVCLGGGVSTALDSAIAASIAAGLHYVIAAGQSNADVANFSPARVPTAVTVGASTISNTKASFSNYGRLLDIWYLGASVIGAGICSDTCTITTSGTCNAASAVAGILAVAISNYGNKTPAQLTADLLSHAVADITGVPSGTTNLRAVPW